MKSSEDRRRAGDGGPSGPSPQPSQVVEQAQQARGQEQYLHYPSVTSTDPAATQYQQTVSVGQSYPQQSQYTSEEVEEVEEGYSNEYDGHQQNMPTSEAGGDSDEHDGTGKRKAPDSNDDGSAGAEGGQRVDADGNPTNDGDPPKKKRRRQALSCTECKRRKIKCDRNHPCSPCARRGDQDKCRWTLLDPIVIPDEDPTNPGTQTTIHTTPYPPTLGNDKYVLRSEHEELKAHVFRLESIIAAISPPGTFPHPLHALQQQQHQSPNPYLNALNQYSILPKQEGGGPGGGPSIPPQHMYLTAGYPPLPIMLNVSTPSGTMNGGSSSTSANSPGIFASYLHNVPFTPSNTVAASNTTFAGTSTASGSGSGQSATIVPSSTTTSPNASTSTPGASSSTAGQMSGSRSISKPRKKAAVNGGSSSSHNVPSTSSASHGGHSHGHLSKAQARAEAKAQRQAQSHLERTHNSSRNPGIVSSSSVGGGTTSRSLSLTHPQDVVDSAQSVYAGSGAVGDDEDDDDEQDADGDGDEDGSGGGGAMGGGKHVHDLVGVGPSSNNLDSRIDALTA